jgi:hypothetical protein
MKLRRHNWLQKRELRSYVASGFADFTTRETQRSDADSPVSASLTHRPFQWIRAENRQSVSSAPSPIA